MLSLNDFREKKILVIPLYDKLENQLKLQNNNILLLKDKKIENKISCHIVYCIFIVGDCTITSKLIQKLKDYGISIFLLNKSFRKYAEINAIAEGNYVLRSKQYKVDKKLEFLISKKLIQNKIQNQYKLIKKISNKDVDINYLDARVGIENVTDMKSLLGIEGNFSSIYFKKVFKDLDWNRRSPRTKEDINNLLLDIGYTFVFNYISSLLYLFGFDVYKGIYHKLFFQRKSLVCDLVEPIRPLVDQQLIKSYNLGQIKSQDFIFKNGAFRFKDYQTSFSYSKIWFKMIMQNHEDLYKYIYGYYKFFQDQAKYEFINFSPFKR